MQASDVWTYRDRSGLGVDISDFDLVGYEIEALDGPIGKVDEATYEGEAGHVVVDTGPWIFGKKVMLPAGVIRDVDEQNERVYVDRTKEQIKNAPEYEESLSSDAAYRGELGSYYGEGGPGYRAWDDTV